MVEQPHAASVGDVTDPHGMQVPLLEHRFDLPLAPGLRDEQHPLLRFREHDLVRGHAGLALRHERHLDVHTALAARTHLGGGAGQAGRAHVLDADQRVGLHDLEAGLHEELFHEGIADLHGGTLLGR